VVSGYDHEAYRPLEAAGFERIEIQHYKMASIRRDRPRDRVVEVIWRRLDAESHHQGSLLAP